MSRGCDFREKQASASPRSEGVRAKKGLGQHFLTDLNIARKIAEAVGGQTAISGRDVLEIGGGMGVLTQFLLERDDIRLWGIEIDRESIAYMRERFPDFATGGGTESATASRVEGGTFSETGCSREGGRLIEGDFLKLDLRERWPGGVKIAGNFPYNISSQIFFKVLENRDIVPEVVGMVQREVAQRIAEPPGSRTYGILSVLLQAWYDIEYLFTVSEGVFSPPPKVKSAVIRLRRNDVRELGCDEVLFVKVVKAAFGQRRKMLRNALRTVFDGRNADSELYRTDNVNSSGKAEHPLFDKRAEQLSVAQFVELTNWVEEKINT